MMYHPDIASLRILQKQYEVIPIYSSIPYDGTDVLDIYHTFRGKYSFLLESGVQTYQSRYSIIALPCNDRFISDGEKSYLIQDHHKTEYLGHPMKQLEKLLKKQSPIYPDIPVFTGGAIGHFNYDVIRLYEQLDDSDKNKLNLPLMQFGFVKELIVIDHERKQTYFIVNADAEHCLTAYEAHCERIDEMMKQYQTITHFHAVPTQLERTLQSSQTRESFQTMVKQAKDHIYAGDIFQIVLSQRLETTYEDDPLKAYANLRKLKASPYMYYLDFDSYVIAGASPELLLQARGDHIKTMPIAGTRKRGKNEQEDALFMEDLKNDPKENAEHMMLVDLGRNDIGKVAKFHSVKVRHLKHIERYSHVMHMTSEVHGELKDGCSAFDAFASVLPAGTLSGAPKIRAMQLIDELENTRREVYGGAIGFIGFNQQFDTCITIRTFLFHNHKVYMQAGAGIVKDSDPDKEYQETMQKAASLLSALGMEVTL